jgi:hypothetical protein
MGKIPGRKPVTDADPNSDGKSFSDADAFTDADTHDGMWRELAFALRARYANYAWR